MHGTVKMLYLQELAGAAAPSGDLVLHAVSLASRGCCGQRSVGFPASLEFQYSVHTAAASHRTQTVKESFHRTNRGQLLEALKSRSGHLLIVAVLSSSGATTGLFVRVELIEIQPKPAYTPTWKALKVDGTGLVTRAKELLHHSRRNGVSSPKARSGPCNEVARQ